MVTVSVMVSPEERLIVWTPPPAMLKLMMSAPAAPFASRIACRSEPAPESLVLVTVKVASTLSQAACSSALTAIWASI